MVKLKKIKKVVLIESKSPGLHVFSSAKLPRLGIIIIGTILKKNNIDVRAYCEDITTLDIKEILDADLIGISTITPTATRTYKLISDIKSKKIDIPIVVGGPHATFCSDEVLDNGADFVIRGEGEKSILELVTCLEDGEDLNNIKGLSFKEDGINHHNPPSDFISDLDNLPFLDWTVLKDYQKINYIPIQTSRGCPYDCKFCSVIKMFGRQYRFKSADYVLDELKYQLDFFADTRAKKLFFYDDNFSSNKNRIKDILGKIIKKGIEMPTWFSQERLDISNDKELLELMYETGCRRVCVGIESINPETLKEYNKKQDVDEIRESILKFHKNKLALHGMFVLGGENDDINTIKDTMKFIIKNSIDTVQLLILTPLPGTEVYENLNNANRLILTGPRWWWLYDAHHVVFQPNLISPWDLQSKVTIDVLSNIYSNYRVIKLFLKAKIINSAIVLKSNLMMKEWGKTNREFLEFLRSLRIPAYCYGRISTAVA